MNTWLITGAGRGIGLALCKELLSRGEAVIGACRNPDGARDLWELASDYKARFRTMELDVADSESLERFETEFSGESVDVLINNAGVLVGANSLRTVLKEDLMKSFAVNTLGPLQTTRALLPALLRSASPKLAHITSRMGSIADNTSGGHYAYRMSKAALNMMHSCIAKEFPQIVSLTLHPGWVQTQMGGSGAPLSAYDSAKGLVDVIQRATITDSGKFLDYKGDLLPW